MPNEGFALLLHATFALAAAFAVSVFLAYASVLAFLYLRQRSILYLPGRATIAPAAAGLAGAEAVRLKTEDGELLQAWFVPPRRNQPLLLYFHGNAGNLADRAPRFLALTAQGAGLLAIDYRGFGGSTGTASERGLHLDADAAYAEALARGYRPERIILFGESLGTGIAIALAARSKVGGLVLEAAFSSALDVAASIYWMFPVRLLMHDPFRSDLHVANIAAPALFIHGSGDTVVPLRFAERLFRLAPEPKSFLIVEGGGHQPLETPWVMQAVYEFINTGRLARRPLPDESPLPELCIANRLAEEG
jgi:fermentation-respiration switch protein FrsA (DUF1100 family)